MQTIDIGLKIHLCEGKMLDTTTDNAIYIYQWGFGRHALQRARWHDFE